MEKYEKIKKLINDSIETKKKLDSENISAVASRIIEMYKIGKKLLIAGNGGSAADAQHFSGELLARFRTERKSLPAIALHCDTSTLTAWANDYDYSSVYARLIDGLGEKGDVFFAISTSGNSKNLIIAIERCKGKGIFVIGLLGKDGGKMKNMCDMSIIVPSNETPRIQESHILIIHIICELIDDALS